MSSIDERVVQMQFQNSQFEKGVKESILSLEKLKNSLKLEEAAEGLKRLQEAGDSFSLAKIGEGIDGLSDRFSAFGTFGARIIENLADTVYNKLGGALKDVTVGQIGAGWQKYADDTKAVQTIMFATGESIENVEAELEKLTWFTDETSYSYTDMVSNISKFTSMNIPLKDARIQMQGIATWAAAAGQGTGEASRAMYNISQAVGAGGMKKIDWKSIENANMATADFKKHAIESAIALGKLNKQAQIVQETGSGKKKKKNTVTVGVDNFAETLSSGWFDKEVIEDVLARYGEYAEKVQDLQKEYEEMGMEISTSEAMDMLSGKTAEFSENAFRAAQEAKTFEEAIDALRDATSTKWLNIFKLIFGNYEKAKELWTKLANDLYDIFVSPLDDLIGNLRKWHNPKFIEDGLGSWNDFMQGVYDIMDGLKGILLTVRDAFSNLIPGVTLDDLKSFSLAVKDFGASFKAAFGIPEKEGEEAVAEVEKVGEAVEDATEKTKEYKQEVEQTSKVLDNTFKIGDKGEEVKKFQEELNKLGYSVGAVDGIYGPKTETAFKKYKSDLERIKDETDDLTDSEKQLAKYSRDQSVDISGKESLDAVANAADSAVSSLEGLQQELKRGSKGEEVKKMQEMLIALGYDLDKYGADGIFGPETQAALKEFERDTGIAIDGVYDAAEAQSLEEAFKLGKVEKRFEELSESLKLGSKGEEVKTLQKRLQELEYDVGPLDGIYGPKTQKALEKFQKDYGLAVDGTYDLDDHKAMGEKLGFNDIVEAAQEAADAVKEVSETTDQAEESVEKYGNRLDQVRSIFGGIFAVGGILLKVVGFVGKALWKVVSLAKPLGDAFLTIAAAVGDAAMSFNEWLGEEGRFDSFFKSLDKTLKPVGDWISKIADSILVFFELRKPLSGTNEEVMTFRKLWSSVVTTVKNSTAFKMLASAFASLKTAFTNFINIFKNSKFTGKGIGDSLLKGLGYLGKGLLMLLTPIAFVISKLAEFIGFLLNKLPSGINKIKEFWNSLSLEGAISSKGIIGFLAKIKSTLISIRDYWFGSVDEKGNKKDGMFAKLYKMITGDVSEFSKGVSGGFLKTVSNIFNSIKPFFTKVVTGFTRLFTGAGGEGLLSSKVVSAIDGFRNGLKTVFAHIRLLVMGNDLNKTDLSNTEKAVLNVRNWIVTAIGNIKTFFVNIWEAIKGFVSSIDFGSWEGFKKSISNLWNSLKNTFLDFFSNLGSGISDSIANFKETAGFIFVWGLAIASIAFVIARVWKIIKTVYTTIKDFSAFLSQSNEKEEQKLSEKILQFAAGIALVAGSIYVLSLIDPGTFWKCFGRLAAILVVLGGFAFLAGKFGQGDPAEAISTISAAIFQISESLVILTAAISALSIMPAEMFWKGFGYLSAILGVISAFTLIMALIDKKVGSVSNEDSGIKSVAEAILILTGVVKLLAMMKFGTFISGMIKLISIMTLIVAFSIVSRLVGKISAYGGIGSSLFAVAGVIAILTVIVGMLSLIPFAKFITGMIKLTSIMALILIFSAASRAIGLIPSLGGTGKNLLAMAGVIAILTIIVGLLGVLPIWVLMKGIVGLTVVMGVLMVFMLVTSKVGAYGAKGLLALIPMVLAIGAIVAIFIILANQLKSIGILAFAEALISMIVVMVALGLLFRAVSKAHYVNPKAILGLLAAAVALSGAMIAFGYAMSLMEDVDPGQMLGFATSMAELMIAFSIVGAIAGAVNPGTAFLGILAVAAAMAIVIAAFAAIMKIPGVDDFLAGGAEKIGKIVGTFVGAMKGAEIEAFNKATGELQSINEVDQGKVDNAVSAAQSVADFGSKLPAKGLVEQAADFIFGSELSQFSKDMTNFGTGFNSFATAINDITDFGDLTTKTNAAIGIAESIKSFGGSLAKKTIDETIAQGIFGSELSQFSGDMGDFGKGFNSFATSINAISDFGDLTTKTGTAIGIAESIKSFGESLKSKSIDKTITDAIFGSELSQFSGDMEDFGLGFNSYANTIGYITNFDDISENTTAAIGIAESINKFGESLKSKSIDKTITDAIFGSELSQFSGDMEDFGLGFNSFANTMRYITNLDDISENTTAAIGIADSINKFGTKLSKKSIDKTITDAIFGSELSQFSGDMSDFSDGFNKYAETMGSITADLDTVKEKTTLAVGIAGQINKFAKKLDNKSFEDKVSDAWFGSKMSGFSGDMSTFATHFNKYARTMSWITADKEKVETQTQTAIGVAEQIAGFLDSLGGMNIETKKTGLAGWFNGEETKGDTVITTISKLAESMKDSAPSFEGLSSGTLEADVEAGIKALQSFATFLTVLSSDAINVTSASSAYGYTTDYQSKLDIYLIGLSSLAAKIQEFAATTEGVDLGSVGSVISSITDFMRLVGIELSSVNLDDIESFDFGKALAENISRMAAALSENNIDFKNAGMNFDLGLTEGLNEYASGPVDAAGAVAKAMLEKINTVLDEHSPSKETFEQGVNFVKGLINGTSSETGAAEAVSGELGNGILDSLQEQLDSGDFSIDNLKETLSGKAGELFSDPEMADGWVNSVMDSLSGGLESGSFEGFSADSLFGNIDPEQIFKDPKGFIKGLFNKDEAEAEIEGAFDAASSSAEGFKNNYSLDKLLQGDLKRGDVSEAVKTMQEQLMALGYNLDNYGADGIFGPETQAAVNEFKKNVGLAADGVFDSNAYQKLVETLNSQQALEAYTEAGDMVSKTVSEGMANGDTSKAKDFASSMIKTLKEYESEFKTVGENFAIGLNNGVVVKSYMALSAAKSLAQQMVNTIKGVFQTASPSKVTAQIGGYFSQGLAKGVKKDGDKAVKSTEQVADAMITTANTTLKDLADLVMQDVDTEPTITPIIDISGAQEAAGSIKELFDDPTTKRVTVTKRLADKATSDADGNPIRDKFRLGADTVEEMLERVKMVSSSVSQRSDGTKGITEKMDTITENFGRFADSLSNMKMVLDTGALVGGTSSAYDRTFGIKAAMAERGN